MVLLSARSFEWSNSLSKPSLDPIGCRCHILTSGLHCHAPPGCDLYMLNVHPSDGAYCILREDVAPAESQEVEVREKEVTASLYCLGLMIQ